jgi:hypothetical protein
MTFWKLAPWLGRLIILAVALLYAMIGLRFVLDPQAALAHSGIAAAAGSGFTNTRTGFGGLPLCFALILCFCLFSQRRLQAGLGAIATVMAVVLAVRAYAVGQDGTFAQNSPLFMLEGTILIIALAGLLVETRRRAREASVE